MTMWARSEIRNREVSMPRASRSSSSWISVSGSTTTPAPITQRQSSLRMPEGTRWSLNVPALVWTVWPALLPPFARTTIRAVEARASVSLPLPSSPHWPPIMIVAVIALAYPCSLRPATHGKRTTGIAGSSVNLLSQIPELRKAPLLFLGEIGGDGDFHLRQQVTVLVRLTELRHALAAEAADLSALRLGRHREHDAAGHRRHADLATEECVVQGNLDGGAEVVANTLEPAVRIHGNVDVHVTRGPAILTWAALAADADTGARADTGGDYHLDGPWLHDLAGAITSRAHRASDDAVAITEIADTRGPHRHAARGTAIRLFETDGCTDLEILATNGSGGTLESRAPRAIPAEEQVEEVREAAGVSSA